MKGFKNTTKTKYASGGRVTYVGPDTNKTYSGPKVSAKGMREFMSKNAEFSKNISDSETAERTGRFVDAVSRDVAKRGDKSGYAWAFDRDKNGPKVPSTKKMYADAERLASEAQSKTKDFKVTPMKDRDDLEYDGGKLPKRGMKKFATGGPVKDGTKRDSEYGDYIIAAKKSQERAKGVPINKSAPVVKKAEGGMTDLKQDKALVKSAVGKHERNMHPGKTPTKLRKGGVPVGYMCGGKTRG